MKALIIGGNSRLAKAFLHRAGPHLHSRIVVRNAEGKGAETETIQVASYAEIPDSAYDGIDAVINCVGTPTPPWNGNSIHDVNVVVPQHAARQAKDAGVEHFVQLSSLSVYGDATRVEPETPPAPQTDYGRSKLAADEALCGLRSKGFIVTILRVPILYGRGSRNKLRVLAHWMLRFGFFVTPSTPVQRSILHFDNAAEILKAILDQRPDRVVLAADEGTFDIALLADIIEKHLNRRIYLIRLPNCMIAPLRYVSKSTYRSLFASSLVVRDSLVASLSMPVRTQDGLRELLAGR